MPIELCNSLDNVKTIIINGSEISESNNYVFTKKGLNIVEFYLLDDTYIPENMFIRINSLLLITLSKSIISIGNDAFLRSGLISITIPKSVQNLNGKIFYLDYLETIILEEGNEYYHKENNCIIENSTNKLIKGFSDSIIPQSTIVIGEYAFSGCDFTSIIPETVTTIEDYAFSGCFSLESVTISDSITSINSGAFIHCESLSEIICLATKPITFALVVFSDLPAIGVLKVPAGSNTGLESQLPEGWTVEYIQ